MNEVTTLEEVGEWGSGGTPTASRPDYYGGSIPWLIIEDLNDEVVVHSQKHINELGLKNSSAKLVEPGTLLIAMYGSIGKLGIAGFQCATNQAIAFCRCNPEVVDTKFLFYFLLYSRPKLLSAGRGGTQQNINQGYLKDFPIPLPPLPEQQRIAATLERADHLRRTRRTARQLSDSFLQSIFLKMFGDPKSNPHNLDKIRLGEVFSTTREGTKCGPFGGALKKQEFVESGVPVWVIDNIVNSHFVEDNCLFISPKKFKDLSAYSVESGDIIISRAGTVGKMCIVETSAKQSIISTNLIRLSLNENEILPIFFIILMTRFGHRVGKIKAGQEGAYTFMNTGILAQLEIPLPPIEKQREFAAIVRRFERLRAGQIEAQRQAQHLFETLLHRAFALD